MARARAERAPAATTPSAQAPAAPATEPLYTISVVSRLAQLPPRAIRSCERAGLVKPARSAGRQGLYSHQDLERLRRIKTLMSDMGVNLAGADVALRLMDRIADLEKQLTQMRITSPPPPSPTPRWG